MRALVLSGGGSKGAWQAGVLKYLMGEAAIDYDLICGTSVGAINAAFLCQTPLGKPQEAAAALVGLWQTVNDAKVKRNWFPFRVIEALWKTSIYDSSPVQRWIRSSLDTTKIQASGRKLRVVSVGLGTGEVFVANESTPNLPEWVIGSSAFPVMMTPATIDGALWSDGGLRNVTPLGEAIRAGATDIDVLICFDPFGVSSQDTKGMHAIPQILLRIAGIMNSEITRADLKIAGLKNDLASLVNSPYKQVNIRVIEPSLGIPYDSLDFSPAGITDMLQMGYADGLKLK